MQLCALTGARVIGSASPSKHDELRAQGLAFVFDSGLDRYAPLVRAFEAVNSEKLVALFVRGATGGRGVEAALAPRNGRWILESYKCLSRCGHLVLFGFAGAATGSSSGILSSLRTLAQVPWLSINPIRLMNDNRSLGGVNLGRMWDEGARTGADATSALARPSTNSSTDQNSTAPTSSGCIIFTSLVDSSIARTCVVPRNTL